MSSERFRLLYVYEERIPKRLQQMVMDHFSEDVFAIDRMTYTIPDEQKCEKMRWAEGVFFAPGRYLSEAVMRSASHIKLMQLWSSGYDKFNTGDAQKYGIPVANNGGANAISVAEHTIALMLAIYKWLPDSHSRTVEGRWTGNSHGIDMFLLNKKVLGLIGFGNIGRAVARRASGFGMKVLYFDPARATPEAERELNAEFCDFEELLSRSDIVSLHLHLNESTKNTIGEHEFALMKHSAALINVSRAALVDYDALLSALATERLWGAGLDVHVKEPTEPDDPLLTHPHVVATPHMAGSTHDAYRTALENAVENFIRVRAGEKPLWVVNGVV